MIALLKWDKLATKNADDFTKNKLIIIENYLLQSISRKNMKIDVDFLILQIRKISFTEKLNNFKALESAN